jgi:type I restriction enzyme, S subunit
VTLPQGWAEATLGEVAETRLGKMLDAAKNKGEHVPYLRNVNVRWGSFDLSDLMELKVTDDELTELSVRDGDLFVCEGGEPGRCAVWRGGSRRLVFQKALHRVRGLGGVEPDYLATFLTYAAANQQFDDLLTGTTIRHFPQVALQRLGLPVPPLAEQHRIVAKLNVLTACLARARTELDRVPVLSRKLRQTAMTVCFDCQSVSSTTLGDLLQGIESGKNLRCEERPPRAGEKGVIKVSAVTWGRFDPRQSKTFPGDYTPPEKARIKQGDLLISRANTLELVGAPVIVEEQPDGLFLSDKVLRLVLEEKDKRWVHWFLRSPAGRAQIENLATGNQLSMRNISQDALRRISIPYPDAVQRGSAIAALEAAFARANRLEAEAARARVLLDRLESKILAKAFRGELVPQDPSDEPAQAILDRIRTQRTAAPRVKRGRRAKEATDA